MRIPQLEGISEMLYPGDVRLVLRAIGTVKRGERYSCLETRGVGLR